MLNAIRFALLYVLGSMFQVQAAAEGDGNDNAEDPKDTDGADLKDPPADDPKDDTEIIVAIGKDPLPADDDAEIMAPDDSGQPPSTTLQNLRKKAREDAKALRRMEQERDAAIAAASAPKPQADPAAVVVGEKPTLENCGYDAEKFEVELTAFHERKRQAEEQDRKRAEAGKAQETAYGERLTAYRQGSAQLRVANFKAAEDVVVATLSNVQQSIIIQHARNASLVVFALGNDSVKLKELAAITDPIAFAIKARELEQEIKTVKRSLKPEGSAPIGSGTGATAAGSNALQRAEKQAETTGDRTEVHKQRMAAKRAAREAGK